MLAAARHLSDEARHAKVLAAVTSHRLEEVLVAAREVHDERRRAWVLAAVAPHRPEDMSVAAREMRDETGRAQVLEAVALHLAEVEYPAVLYRLWQETIPILSQRTRPDLLSDLAALMPVIHKLGGDKGVADTLDAIQKVCAWWP